MSLAVMSALLLGCSQGGAAAPQAAIPVRKEPLGANIDGVADWSRTFAFSDLMKQSRSFGKPDKPWEAITTLDANGWPTTDFGVILLAAMNGVKSLPTTYKVSFECNAKPTIQAVASAGEVSNLTQNGKTWTADLTMPQQEQLMLSFTNTNGGVRNLKVMHKVPTDGSFTKMFLDHVRRFTTLRFMDWGHTNGNQQVKWSDRNLVERPSYANERAVPYEVMFELANKVQADAWVCVPAHANDDYVMNLAALCKKSLDPKLKLYIEYSNEVWNWGFEQAHYNKDLAEKESASQPDMSWDGEANKWTWPARRIAKRLMQIRGIFEKVYGPSFKDTVRLVLAAQIVWPENWMEEGLKYIEHNYGPAKNNIYAISGAPYFNLDKVNEMPNATKDQVLDALEKTVDSMKTWAKADWYAKTLQRTGVKFIAYEAGPDTFGPNSIPAKKAAQLDPRMKQILLKYYRTWRGMGGELMCYFVAGATSFDGQYGTWGLTDDYARSTPKLEAVDDILAGRWKQ